MSEAMAHRIRSWLVDQALPLWSTNGVDDLHGGFNELLAFDGQFVPDTPKRMRIHCRQLYTFSHARLLGWPVPDSVLATGFDFLTEKYWHPDGGFVFLAEPNGTWLDETRESYEQAFALLGLSWYHRATGDARAVTWIDDTLAFLDTLADPVSGGWRESVPDKTPRRQNPHMHLLEAFLSLEQTFPEQGYLSRASTIVDMALEKFIDSEGRLGEYFDNEWKPVDGDPGQIVEPGHHFEWVWLLDRFTTQGGTAEVAETAELLFDHALQHGVDRSVGLGYDAITRAGDLTKPTKRLWVQTEALKAHLTIDRHAPSRGDDDATTAIAQAMFDHYLHDNGTWQDKLDGDNRGVGTSSPTSTMYHVFVAFDEYLKRFEGPDYRLG